MRPSGWNGLSASRLWILLVLGLILSASGVSLLAQQQNRSRNLPATGRRESFRRPKPSLPSRPTVPSQNRYQTDKVFLENADSLFRTDLYEDVKIVKGNVKFRQGGMWMYCDSAWYNQERNLIDAFGHVRMEQGDTLFIYADKLFYDGFQKLARLRCGPSQREVILKNRHTRLTTDSLDYSLAMRLGWYEYGGRLEDDVNTLTSEYGQYSPETKDAEFFYDVVLVNRRDGFRLLTDTLYYNTGSHIARIVSPTEIQSDNDTVIARDGTYNSLTGVADLTSRSLMLHRDSADNVITLEGDSIVYDRQRRISRAYSFRGPGKISAPVVLTDTARRATLLGGFGLYNDSTREATVADYPLMMEYSRPDTLFLRADTIRSWVITTPERPQADSIAAPVMKEYHKAVAQGHGRFFKEDLQGVADTITFIELDSMLYLTRKPVVWSGERQISGRRIEVHLMDSTADWATLPDKGMMMEHVDEDFYNQLSANRMHATLSEGTLSRLDAEGNVQTIFLPQENDSTYNKLVNAESSFMTIDMAPKGTDLERLKMWPEVTGSVIPIFLVKTTDKMLQNAVWHDDIRPRREWYGDRVRWADDLGEVSPALEEYFKLPDEFGAPPVTN